jgi:hypothetical protein
MPGHPEASTRPPVQALRASEKAARARIINKSLIFIDFPILGPEVLLGISEH